ncbi:MAG: ABC transporter permease subunit [Candidatus Omnitrophica bacterium]|nr:ABC transporter permease subunit [Candidatus Omnitrophota bacterium]
MYYRAKKVVTILLIHAFLFSVALSCIVPFLWMMNVSLKHPEEFQKGLIRKSRFSGQEQQELIDARVVREFEEDKAYLVWNVPNEKILRARLKKINYSYTKIQRVQKAWEGSRDFGLRPTATFRWENYRTVIVKYEFWRYFFNSLFYTFVTVTAIVIISSLSAYAFSRLQFPGKNLIFYMFLTAMMIPLPAGFVPVYVLLNKLHLVNRTGYVFAMTNMGLSLSIYLLKTFFDGLSRDLEDAARIDGCNKLQIWWHVGLPLVAPALAVVVIFNALNVWNEFVLASLMFTEESLMPLQVGLMEFSSRLVTQHTLIMAALTVATLPIILLYLKMQNQVVKGLTAGATVG